jgi:hypothetical protein
LSAISPEPGFLILFYEDDVLPFFSRPLAILLVNFFIILQAIAAVEKNELKLLTADLDCCRLLPSAAHRVLWTG